MERATTESGFAFCSRNETLPLGTDHIRKFKMTFTDHTSLVNAPVFWFQNPHPF
jgi:hypothetical protein